MSEAADRSAQRIDQWLWFARIVKSRTLAQALVARGKVRLNRVKIEKPSASVKPGDVLTLSLGPRVRSLEILGLGARRGPAPEAGLLFRDLLPAPARPRPVIAVPDGLRAPGTGRPTKRDRRQTERLKGG